MESERIRINNNARDGLFVDFLKFNDDSGEEDNDYLYLNKSKLKYIAKKKKEDDPVYKSIKLNDDVSDCGSGNCYENKSSYHLSEEKEESQFKEIKNNGMFSIPKDEDEINNCIDELKNFNNLTFDDFCKLDSEIAKNNSPIRNCQSFTQNSRGSLYSPNEIISPYYCKFQTPIGTSLNQRIQDQIINSTQIDISHVYSFSYNQDTSSFKDSEFCTPLTPNYNNNQIEFEHDTNNIIKRKNSYVKKSQNKSNTPIKRNYNSGQNNNRYESNPNSNFSNLNELEFDLNCRNNNKIFNYNSNKNVNEFGSNNNDSNNNISSNKSKYIKSGNSKKRNFKKNYDSSNEIDDGNKLTFEDE